MEGTTQMKATTGEDAGDRAKKKVLLVDDVQLFLEQQKTFFNKEEFELLFARTGAEALRVAGEARPDLIFMDYYMPDMNGDRCCRFIKSVPELAGTPVIMITAGVDQEDFQKCWEAGCDDIIPKPINRNYFHAIVKKYLPLAERNVPRFVARLRVQYGVRQEMLLDDFSINVSTGGLFIETFRPLPVGASLTLAFVLPESATSISCQGKVAWVNHPEMIKVQALPAGMGIQFVDLSLDGMNAIRDFIKKGALLPFW